MKMRMNQTVNIMIMKVVNFIVALLVDALVFFLINGDHIPEVKFINTIKQENYLLELSNVKIISINFIINYYENYVIISFLFTYLYYGSSHHIPPYFFLSY
jgi:TRAP-type mannitol/chloroaromatic compound transport system permease large subunit